MTLRLALVAGASLFGLSGCTLPGLQVPNRAPVRWIMVEKPFGDLARSSQNDDGQVDPRSLTLTLQPLYPEDVSWEVLVDPRAFYVEILEIWPSRLAAPGETVSATVRVARAQEGELYRLIARAYSSDVHFVGDRELLVHGSTTASFRFTSSSAGRAGIEIAVERINAGREPEKSYCTQRTAPSE